QSARQALPASAFSLPQIATPIAFEHREARSQSLVAYPADKAPPSRRFRRKFQRKARALRPGLRFGARLKAKGSGDGAETGAHQTDRIHVGLFAGAFLGALARLVALVEQFDLLQLLERFGEQRLGVFELDAQ